MSRAGLIEHLFKIDTGSSRPWGRFTLATLTIILCIGVSHKVKTIISLAFTVASLVRRVMLLPLSIVALPSLPWIFIIRLKVHGTIRVSILNQSCHERPHVIAIMFEPP